MVVLASCSGRSHPEPGANLTVVNLSVHTVTVHWNVPGMVGPFEVSTTQSEAADGCARYDHGVQASDSGLVIKSDAASLPVDVPHTGEIVALYYLVRPDGRIEATTADVADATPTSNPSGAVPSICPAASATH